MIIRTSTERVKQAVRYAMEFLLLHHPIDCPVCDQSGECWLQDYYMAYSGHDSRYALGDKTRRKKATDLGPRVKLDQERCILCTRCVRFTRNVTHTNEIQVLNRGHKAEIGTFEDTPLTNDYSMNVVDVCPVGALTSADFRFKVRAWFLQGTSSVCAGCSTGCNLRVDHSARPLGGGIPGYSATEGKIYRTVGRRNVEVNKSWLCDEGRLSFHALERWPRPGDSEGMDGHPATSSLEALLATAHKSLRNDPGRKAGDAAIAALGSATNTNEALVLMKKYFKDHVDFRIGQETETYQKMQDDLLRRVDKHPNTRGAIDLGLAGSLDGLRGLRQRAEQKQLRGAWISFHPQLVGDDSAEIITELQQLIGALEFSVVSTTHDFEWSRKATILLPMAAWSEERGTYTNYAGRIQITSHAVMPPGDALPLHVMMVEMLKLSNVQVTKDPGAIFEWLCRETPPIYGGLDYETVDRLALPSRNAVPENKEVLQ